MILKDGNFHWDLEEQKEEEKRQSKPFSKKRSIQQSSQLTAFSRLKCNKITAVRRMKPALQLHIIRHLKMHRGFQGNFSTKTWKL
jgi:hypothetical protein